MLSPLSQTNSISQEQIVRENAQMAANQEPLQKDSLPVRALVAAGAAIDNSNFSLQSAIVLPFLEKCYTPGDVNIQRLADTAWFFERIKLRKGPFMYGLVDAVEKTKLYKTVYQEHCLTSHIWLASYSQIINLFKHFASLGDNAPLPALKHLSAPLLVDRNLTTIPQIIKVIRLLSKYNIDRTLCLPFRDSLFDRLEQISVRNLTNLLQAENYFSEESVREDFDPFTNQLTQLMPAMNLDDFFKLLEVIGRYDDPDTVFYTELLVEVLRGIQKHAGQMSVSQIAFIFRNFGNFRWEVDKNEIEAATNSLIRRIPAVVEEINPEQVDNIISSIVDTRDGNLGWDKDRENAILALTPYVGSLKSRQPTQWNTPSSILMAFWLGKYSRREERTEAAMSFLAQRISEDINQISTKYHMTIINCIEHVLSAFSQFGLRNSDTEMLMTAIARRISVQVRESTNLYSHKMMLAFTTFNLHNEEIDEAMSLLARFGIQILELSKEISAKNCNDTYQLRVPEWLPQLAWTIGEYNLRNEQTLSTMEALERHLPAAIEGMSPLMIARAVYGFAKFDLEVGAMKGTVDTLTEQLNKLCVDESNDELTQAIIEARKIVFSYYINVLAAASSSSSSSSSQQLAPSEDSEDSENPPLAKKARFDK